MAEASTRKVHYCAEDGIHTYCKSDRFLPIPLDQLVITNDMSKVTCKRCLLILAKRQRGEGLGAPKGSGSKPKAG